MGTIFGLVAGETRRAASFTSLRHSMAPSPRRRAESPASMPAAIRQVLVLGSVDVPRLLHHLFSSLISPRFSRYMALTPYYRAAMAISERYKKACNELPAIYARRAGCARVDDSGDDN